MRLTGHLSQWVTTKDIVLRVAGRYNFNPFMNRSIEFGGEALRDLSIAGRMVLSNMGVDLGAKFAIAEYDAVTAAYLAPRAVEAYEAVVSDADAPVAAAIDLPLDEIRPLVAHPDGLFNVSRLPTARASASIRRSSAPARTAGSRTWNLPPGCCAAAGLPGMCA